MARGDYYISNVNNKDSSFKSFICALLCFLALCIIILLCLLFIKPFKSNNVENNTSENIEIFNKSAEKYSHGKIVEIKVPLETSTEKWFSISKSESETTIEANPAFSEERNEIDAFNEPKNAFFTTTPTTITSKLSAITESTSNYLENENKVQTVKPDLTTYKNHQNIFEASTNPIVEENFIPIKKSNTDSFKKVTETSSTEFSKSENATEADKNTKFLFETTTAKIMENETFKENTFTNSEKYRTIIKDWETTTEGLQKSKISSTASLTETETEANTEFIAYFSQKEITDSSSLDNSSNDITTEIIAITNNTVSTTTVQPLDTSTVSTKSTVVLQANGTCKTAICKSTTARMLSFMNHSVDPCENFYEFACGGNVVLNSADTYILDKLSLNGNASALTTFKQLYASCLNFQKNMPSFYDRLNIFSNNDLRNYSLTELFAEMVQMQTMPFFDIGLDILNETYILQVLPLGFSTLRNTISDWSIFDDIKNRCLVDLREELKVKGYINLDIAYKNHINCRYKKLEKIMTNFLKNIVDLKNMTQELHYFDQEIFSYLTLSKALALLGYFRKMEITVNQRQEIYQKQFETYNLYDLDNKFGLINWTNFFSIISDKDDVNTYENTVQVFLEDRFIKIFDHLRNNYLEKDIKDILIFFHILHIYYNLVDIKEHFFDDYCYKLNVELMPDIYYLIYKKSQTKKLHANNLQLASWFEKLKLKFEESFNDVNWLRDDKIFKDSMRSKLHALTSQLVNEGDYLMFENSLNSKYAKYNLSVHDFGNNLLQIMKHYRRSIYALDGGYITNITGTDIFSYFLDPNSKRPVSFYGSNNIYLPYGMFRNMPSPNTLPHYFLEAKIKYYIAREIVRHFDPVGIKNRIEMQTNSTQAYNYLINSLRDLIENVTIYDDKVLLFKSKDLSILWIDDIITESSAFRLVYDSIEQFDDTETMPWIGNDEHFTKEKVFFLIFAQEFCEKKDVTNFMIRNYEDKIPSNSLVLENIMKNSQHFADAFQCGPGSTLNPGVDQKYQFPRFDYDASNDYGSDTN